MADLNEQSASYARRRSALKGRVLMWLSIMAGDGSNWEVLAEYADGLGLGDEAVQSVLDEVGRELWNRSARHPSPDEVRPARTTCTSEEVGRG